MMDNVTGLQQVSRVSYYMGWLAALCGALAHFGVGAGVFRSMDLPQRNLFEGSVLFFLISAASALRSGASSKTN